MVFYNSLSYRVSAMYKMLLLFILGFCIELLHGNGDSHTGGCTATCTSTCPNNPLTSTSCSNDSLVIEKRLEQLNVKIREIEAKLDHLMAHANITDLYPPSPLLHSCEEINTNWPDSSSDYYIIADTNGHPRHVYCHMESLCNSGGGWMRVAYFNMSDPTEECPPGFRLYNQSGIRSCGRPASTPAGYCQSVKFHSYNITYSQVCGRITGYQCGSLDNIYSCCLHNKNINQAYVDGVSITRGNPRNHIWTFMTCLQKNYFQKGGQCVCPCAPNSPVTVPSFIGNDYFCESGCPGNWQYNLFCTNPLWDGKQCGLIEKACCLAPGLPWFHKTLNTSTTDYLEIRLCAPWLSVGYYEIYVK